MKSTVYAIAFFTGIFLQPLAAQQSYTFETVDFPNNSGGTYVEGINSAGDVAGFFGTIAKSGRFIDVGFTRLADGRFMTVEDPFTVSNCQAFGISDSDVVVGAYQSNGSNGFTYSQGKYRPFDIAIQSHEYPTELNAISSNGSIVGNYTVGSSVVGFERTATGAVQILPNLNGQPVYAASVNSSGVIVGLDVASVLAGVQNDGFILPSGGSYQKLDYPGAIATDLLGINDSGVIVGFQYQMGANFPSSFVYSDGQFTDFVVPGASYTEAYGINASGVIVGTYGDSVSTKIHGFIATPVR